MREISSHYNPVQVHYWQVFHSKQIYFQLFRVKMGGMYKFISAIPQQTGKFLAAIVSDLSKFAPIPMKNSEGQKFRSMYRGVRKLQRSTFLEKLRKNKKVPIFHTYSGHECWRFCEPVSAASADQANVRSCVHRYCSCERTNVCHVMCRRFEILFLIRILFIFHVLLNQLQFIVNMVSEIKRIQVFGRAVGKIITVWSFHLICFGTSAEDLMLIQGNWQNAVILPTVLSFLIHRLFIFFISPDQPKTSVEGVREMHEWFKSLKFPSLFACYSFSSLVSLNQLLLLA